MPRSRRKPVTWALKANFVILAVDIGLLLVASVLSNANILVPLGKDFFSLLLLLEAGIIFLIGGIIAFSSSVFPSKVREHMLRSDEKWSKEKLKKGEARANLFILAGILLFLESVALALLV